MTTTAWENEKRRTIYCKIALEIMLKMTKFVPKLSARCMVLVYKFGQDFYVKLCYKNRSCFLIILAIIE